MHNTSVLIVGGSLVGLSAALFLAWRGVGVTVIEKHPTSAPHPRAAGFTEHTLEFFRAVGIVDQVPQVDAGTKLRRVTVVSLAGEWGAELPWTPGEDAAFGQKASPCRGAAFAQDRLEPILRAAATRHGADLRLGTELLSFSQDEDGLTAHVRERATGNVYPIHGAYMIAADGADSAIRETLGIVRQGVGHLRTLRSILFRCAEADHVLDRGVQQFEIRQLDFRAFLTSYGDGRWVLMFDDDAERSEAELIDAVRRALGADWPFEMITTGRWDMAGRIAVQYQAGRIFLAGDAAHQLPPTRGGFGANTGIGDAYNIAWKLGWVLSGRSDPRLLDSYNDERQPIGWLRHQQTFARPDYAPWVREALQDQPLYGNEAMELGQLMRSSAVIGAGPELPPAASPEEWAGQPGTRAPHIWIERDGEPISTIDLFTRGFVLISSAPRWIDGARRAASELKIELEAVQVGVDVAFLGNVSFEHAFGVSDTGASLVRPDGIIAWRSIAMVSDPFDAVRSAISSVAALT